jgi:CDP-diacylglycerol--glycerol-3-phosphate 3-phosphatidyltransferase
MTAPTRPAADDDRTDEAASSRRLAAAWGWWCLGGLLGLAVVAAALLPSIGAAAGRWLAADLLALVGVLFFVRRSLSLNRRTPDGPLLGDIGAGNHATIARGVLIAQLPGYLLVPWPSGWQAWLPALTFTLSLAADYLDGFLARRADRVTGMGEVLDIEFDGLGLMGATALAVHYGQLPLVYFLTVGCARYVFLLVSWLARRAGRPVHPLPPSNTRRPLAGVTMELAAAALWPIVASTLMTLAGAIVALPFLAGFLRDGAAVLGWIDPTSARYRRVRAAIIRMATSFLPPILRASVLVLLGPLLVAGAGDFAGSVQLARAAGIAAPVFFTMAVILISTVGLASVAAGFAGRAGAVGIVVAYGLSLSMVEMTVRGAAAWGGAFAIYIFGTGPWSLWAPERAIYMRRAGEPTGSGR